MAEPASVAVPGPARVTVPVVEHARVTVPASEAERMSAPGVAAVHMKAQEHMQVLVHMQVSVQMRVRAPLALVPYVRLPSDDRPVLYGQSALVSVLRFHNDAQYHRSEARAQAGFTWLVAP